ADRGLCRPAAPHGRVGSEGSRHRPRDLARHGGCHRDQLGRATRGLPRHRHPRDPMRPDYPSAAPLVPQPWLDRISTLPAEGGPSGADWARRARRLVIECLEQWNLRVAGPAMTGWTAVVFPVCRSDGTPAALKVGWPHEESRMEHT